MPMPAYHETEEDAAREAAWAAEQEGLKQAAELRHRHFEKTEWPRRARAMREDRPKRLQQATLAAQRAQALRQLADEEAIEIQLETNIVKTRFAIQRQGLLARYRAQGLDD